MYNIFAIIIFAIGILGMAIMLFKKAHELAEYVPEPEVRSSSVIKKITEKVSDKIIPDELFWQKTLSKIKILALKTDNKTSEWLRKLREKSTQNKARFSDNYWEKLKK